MTNVKVGHRQKVHDGHRSYLWICPMDGMCLLVRAIRHSNDRHQGA